jgi:GGDEF domain-containing protein
MYSPKKELETAKIRLPRRNAPPGPDYLQEVLSHAYGKIGREVEGTWTDPTNGRSFSLVVRVEREATLPVWTLWEDDGKATTCTWRYESNDLTLIGDMLCMRQPSPGLGLGGQTTSSNKVPAFGQPLQPQPQNMGNSGGLGQSGLAGKLGGQRVSSSGGLAQPPASERLSDAKTGFGGGRSSYSVDPTAGEEGFGPNPHVAKRPSQEFNAAKRPSQELNALAAPAVSIEQLATDDFMTEGAAAGQTAASAPKPISPAGDGVAAAVAADQSAQYEGSPAGTARNNINRATRALLGPVADEMRLTSATIIEGSLERLQVATLLQALSMSQVTGKLEIIGEESVGRLYFMQGAPVHATTDANLGDSAICELVAWRNGMFRFLIDDATPMRSVQNRLDANVMEGIALLDQKKHLEEAGLTYESYLFKKHKNLSESELKVFLMKGHPVDFERQVEVYRVIGQRCTFADLLRDRPMESLTWTRILYNFLTCGLIEIKPPEAVSRAVLDFLGDSQAGVQSIITSMMRPETGIYTYHALLYLLEYEFYRFESYGWPMTLVILELNKKSATTGLDSISAQEAAVMAKRIGIVKRPLDSLAHFETIHYALLLPNTRAPSGAYVANRILQSLLATPISPAVDRKSLQIAMGIASLPADGDDIEGLIREAKNALTRAREGDFPIVMASGNSKSNRL